MNFETKTKLMPHQVDAVNKLLPTRIGGLFMDMGTGKALPLDASVLTPTGWTEMGKIKIGDNVIGANGHATKVIGVYPQGEQDIYKIIFSDGTEAQCTADHLWQVITPCNKHRGKGGLILSTNEMLTNGIKHANGNRKYQIPLVLPVEFESSKNPLPVDPYILGVLIGNGYLRKLSISISSNDPETIENIRTRLPLDVELNYKSKYDYDIVGKKRGQNSLLKSLQSLDLCGKRSFEKFIPHQYLFANIKERIELLQGLMDTDGTINKDKVGIEYSTTSKQLAIDIKFLAQSLGALVKISEKYPKYTYNDEKRTGRPAYRLYIRFPNGIQPFKLSRKQIIERVKYLPVRAIERIEFVGRKQAQCIAVSAEDGLFVINDFIVTHNTRTVSELIYRRQHKIDKVVYFCPVSLKETVRQEIFKHTDLSNQDVYVFNDKTNERNVPEVFWYIIGIESMSSSSRVVMTANKLITENTYIVLDESSYIKGYHSLRTMRITKISERARYRNILTGTPLSQGVVDLYSQMYFLSPKILGYNSFYSFAANHLEYSDKFPGMIVRAHNIEYLAAKIKPYVYQVTKEESLTLPPKLYETRYFSMTWEQRCVYEETKNKILDEWEHSEDSSISSIMIFRLFSALQQITCGFYNERQDSIWRKKKRKDKKFVFYEFEHKRLDVLWDIIRDIPQDDKIVIFCKFQYDIDSIRKMLIDVFGSDSTAIFCGKLSEQERNEQVIKFRNEARFFVINQASGGHGLTLNEAHYVIFYNNGFKYSERLQAEDRCHRIGQEYPVTYIDIECLNSIDERIAKALSKKGNAVAEFRREVEKVKKERIKELIKAL